MTLQQFIKLILSRLRLIIGVGIVMALTVYFTTRNDPKTYTSFTVIYTGIASGHTIEGSKQADYYVTSNAFDNILSIINSRQTKEEVILKLLAEDLMMEEPSTSRMNYNSFMHLQEVIPPIERDNIIVDNDIDLTVAKLYNIMHKNDTNRIYKLMNSKDPHYSMDALSKIQAYRVNSSDLIKIEYECDDPAICQRTLEHMVDVFMKINKRMKKSQSNNVVAYFIKKLAEAQKKLDAAEHKFLLFNTSNNIINYYEQTKFISAEKEELDNKITEMKMSLHAAEAAVSNVEVKLGAKAILELHSSSVIEKKRHLSILANQLTMLEVKGKKDTEEYKALNKEKEEYIAKLEQSLEGLFTIQHTTEGVPIKELLVLWVENTIEVEEEKAKLNDLLIRQQEFLVLYKKMAPIGAELKSIEREIDVAEREYLNILHNLNQAKLRQQNIEMSAQLDTVDDPYFPLKPQPAKRLMLIIIALMAGIIFTSFVVIALEYLNSNLKNEEIVTDKTGLESLGMYPSLTLRTSKGLDLEKVKERAELQVYNRLNAFIRENRIIEHPIRINIISTRQQEGKTTFTNKIAERYKKMGQRVAVISQHKSDDLNHFTYDFKKHHELTATYKQLLDRPFDQKNYDIILFESPNMIDHLLPYQIMDMADCNILMLRSNRTWTKADAAALEHYQKLVSSPIRYILNGTRIEALEDIIGDIPKKRGKIRSTIKRWVRMEFRSRVHF